MSETRFKAVYALNVSDKAQDESFLDTLESWKIPFDREKSSWDGNNRHIEAQDPVAIVTNGTYTVLQFVVKDEVYDGSNAAAFRPIFARAILEKAQNDMPELFKFMFEKNRVAFYATSYVWDTSTDEPVVL